jgi:hypothetical protein
MSPDFQDAFDWLLLVGCNSSDRQQSANIGRSTRDAAGQGQSLQDLDAALPNWLYGIIVHS